MRSSAFLLLIVALAGCSTNPPPETSPIAETGIVGGKVQMSIVQGAAVPQVMVSVAGATVTGYVSRLGDFVLPNVPAGALELRFTGTGIAAALPLGAIAGGETVTLDVALTPAHATASSIARVRGDQAMIEGLVEEPATPLPANTIIVGGRIVTLPAGIAAPKPGTRVRVTGVVNGGGVAARELTVL